MCVCICIQIALLCAHTYEARAVSLITFLEPSVLGRAHLHRIVLPFLELLTRARAHVKDSCEQRRVVTTCKQEIRQIQHPSPAAASQPLLPVVGGSFEESTSLVRFSCAHTHICAVHFLDRETTHSCVKACSNFVKPSPASMMKSILLFCLVLSVAFAHL